MIYGNINQNNVHISAGVLARMAGYIPVKISVEMCTFPRTAITNYNYWLFLPMFAAAFNTISINNYMPKYICIGIGIEAIPI